LIAPSITHSATRCSTFFLHQFDDGDPPETGSPPLAAPAPAMVHGADLDRPSLCLLARPAQRTRAAAPPPLRIDTFEDRSWISLTPFVLTGLRLAATPSAPVLLDFPPAQCQDLRDSWRRSREFASFVAKEGSLEQFLVERYCLCSMDESGAMLRAEIHHPPWPLQAALSCPQRRPFSISPVGRTFSSGDRDVSSTERRGNNPL